MTAMPAWGEVERQDQVWDMVAFLEALPRLSAGDYARLRAGAAAPPPFLAVQPRAAVGMAPPRPSLGYPDARQRSPGT
jgi:hypothetical protein